MFIDPENVENLFIADEKRVRNLVKGFACPVHGKARKRISFDYDRNENITEIEVSGCCCKEFAEAVADKLKTFGVPVVFKHGD